MHASQADKDYYELLGVERSATCEQIREAYRELARIYHPDSNFYSEIIDDSISTGELDMFKLITAAYNILMDKEQRQEYDSIFNVNLPDWESADSNENLSFNPAKKQNSYAYGTFGTQGSRRIHRPKVVNPEGVAQVKSVAEMIGVKRRFLWKLRLLFGF